MRLTSVEEQFVIDRLKTFYDEQQRALREEDFDEDQREQIHDDMELNRGVQQKILGHAVRRAGWDYK